MSSNTSTPKLSLPPFLEVESPQVVQVPCPESLLADKLTAFAPNTVGVPLNERFSQQVLKQLFDISQLYSYVQDPELLFTENLRSFEAEAGYRTFSGSHQDYLDDVIDTAFLLCAIEGVEKVIALGN